MKQKTPTSSKTTKSSSIRPKASKSAKSKKSAALSPEVLPAQESEDTSSTQEDSDSDLEERNVDQDLEKDLDTDELANPSDSELQSSLPTPISNLESESQTVPQTDPLRHYLEELRKYPLLDTEQEFALATQLREKGDLQAARALVSANLRLVVKIAFEYRTFYSNVLDLIQEGNIGLMKAVSKFDPTKGARLGYYASWWIRSYILKYLLDNFRLVKVGTTQAQKKLFYHLMREKERLEAQGLLAGPKLLAEKLNVREKDVVEMEQRLSGRGVEMSLDAPIDRGEGKTTSHMELLVDESDTADEALARQELLKLLRDQLPEFEKLLNDKEKKILRERLLSEEPKTLQEVADLYGLTRERARQIEAKLIEKLRDFLKPHL